MPPLDDDPDELTPEERHRLDLEWVALTAVREALALVTKSSPTYLHALGVAQDLSSELFSSEAGMIAAAQEPQDLREYRQKAQAKSELTGSRVEAAELIRADIEEHVNLVNTSGNTDQLTKRLKRLQTLENQLVTRDYSENALIVRDMFSADRAEFPAPPTRNGNQVEYLIANKRAFRIRMLHPDNSEQISGADLIYEYCDQNRKQVRLAFLQYKIWNGKVLYFSQAKNLPAQLEKMRSLTCDAGLCKCTSNETEELTPSFRLPFCASFLRPTDKLQSADSRLLSSGEHLPICLIEQVSDQGTRGKVIRKSDINSKSVSQKAFDELFSRNLIGSDWIPYSDVTSLYQDIGLFQSTDSIVIHAQECYVTNAEDSDEYDPAF